MIQRSLPEIMHLNTLFKPRVLPLKVNTYIFLNLKMYLFRYSKLMYKTHVSIIIKKKSCISEEALIPERHSEMGSACSECDLEQIQQIDSNKWDEIVPVTPLRAGYEETRLNFQKVNCSFNKITSQ